MYASAGGWRDVGEGSEDDLKPDQRRGEEQSESRGAEPDMVEAPPNRTRAALELSQRCFASA